MTKRRKVIVKSSAISQPDKAGSLAITGFVRFKDREGYAMSNHALTKDLDTIRGDCESVLKKYALLGAANGINPIPGLDVGIDAGVCLKLMLDIRQRFGLNECAESKLRQYEVLLPLVKKVFDYATKEGVAILLKSMGKKYLGKNAAKYVPIIGQGIAAAAGYALMMYFGKSYIEDCYRLSQNMKKYDIDASYEYVD